jgi:putative ABC transport system permease protein
VGHWVPLRIVGRVVRVSFRVLSRQPIRTFLLVQGVLWGTALAVSLPAVLQGTRRLIESQAAQQGSDRIVVTQEAVDGRHRLTWDLVSRLRQAFRGQVKGITAYEVRSLAVANRNGRSIQSVVFLVDEEFFDVCPFPLREGRLLSRREVIEGDAVAVVIAAPELLPFARPGATVDLGRGRVATVVGVVDPLGGQTDIFGYARDHPFRRLIEELQETLGTLEPDAPTPRTTYHGVLVSRHLFEEAQPSFIEMRTSPAEVPELRKRVFRWMAERGLAPVIYANVVVTFLYGETIARVVELNRVLSLIAITVGALIASATTVLSVLERRREIAIRRVEGAQHWQILCQFTVENLCVCAVGGVLGIPTGLGLAALRCELSPAAGVSWIVPYGEIFVIYAVVLMAGFIAGLIPAIRAVRVDPIEVLRFE